MTDGDARAGANTSDRLVEQSVRNRIIEYLELTASFEEQRRYEREVPIVHVPYELINQWEDQVWTDPRENPYNLDVYDAEEVEALSEYQVVWEAVATAVPDHYPTLSEVQALPEWEQLRAAAENALAVFMRRGKDARRPRTRLTAHRHDRKFEAHVRTRDISASDAAGRTRISAAISDADWTCATRNIAARTSSGLALDVDDLSDHVPPQSSRCRGPRNEDLAYHDQRTHSCPSPSTRLPGRARPELRP